MRIKCGRKEYDVGPNDRVLDNGACYQIITQTATREWGRSYPPRMSKTLFAKLQKENKIVLTNEQYNSGFGDTDCRLWAFTE